ncbi:MAG: hypothetical protein CBB68_09570 [Rhodospirillaceae bacterium TMED8]|nr:flagellin-like protein [Magnetovibrio sp.]OUT50109.1 MAG: hypothetical protein CBB68_09570 [Rhodospirillaceae bacterium TMED8]
MSGEVTLTASVRQSLLSLQGTTSLIERTQNRLSTGLSVASAVDDPVSFFQAKSLSDRASDFLEKKDGIDQGISAVTAALDGVDGITELVRQLKGISNSLKSATESQTADLVTQFNDIRSQINNLTADSTYQGMNLINGAGQSLSIEFANDQTASLVTISSVDLRSGTAGLSVTSQTAYTAGAFVTNFGTINSVTQTSGTMANRFLSTTSDFTMTWAGPSATFSAGETVTFTYGTGSTYSLITDTSSAVTVTNGGTVDIDVVTSTTAIASGYEFALKATANKNLVIGYSQTSGGNGNVSAGEAYTLTYNGNSPVTLTTADTNLVFAYGTAQITLSLTSGTTLALTASGDTFAVTFLSSSGPGLTGATGAAYIGLGALQITGTTAADTGNITRGILIGGGDSAITAATQSTRYVRAGDTTTLNAAIAELDTALTTLRTNAQSLGTNVALLNTRLDFTEAYVNTLSAGSDKLTLADINEEGANLLALQTRQQLGIQALSLAAQAEASILQLFG